MAAVMQAANTFVGFDYASWIKEVVNDFAQKMDGASGQRLSRHLAPYTAVSPSRAFGSTGFGVERALLTTTKIEIKPTVMDVAFFTIEEARERLSSFLDGSFVPDTIQELIAYLGEKFLRIETHVYQGDQAVNVLVDTKSGASVPAHQVDPRLSHSMLLQTALRDDLRQQIGLGAPDAVTKTWQGFYFAADPEVGGSAYTVNGDQGWYGMVYAMASSNPAKNAELLAQAKRDGIELILPQRGPESGITPGMPILRKSHSLKAETINPVMAYERLEQAFGKNVHEAFERMGAETMRFRFDATREAAEIDMEDFRARFVRSEDDFEGNFEDDVEYDVEYDFIADEFDDGVDFDETHPLENNADHEINNQAIYPHNEEMEAETPSYNMR